MVNSRDTAEGACSLEPQQARRLRQAVPDLDDWPRSWHEWLTNINRITRNRVRQPESTEARIAQAIWSTAQLGRSDLVVVDTIQDLSWQRYGSAPSAAFVIDASGRIVLRQPWVEPNGIRQALDALLQRDDGSPTP